jgi:thymidylate kinase
MLVCIVGADGSGKSTLTQSLNQELKKNSLNTHNVDRWDILNNELVPCGRFIKKDLKQLRTCVAEMPLNARFRFLTWAMSISLDYARKSVGENGVLLFDSFWQKHAAVEIAYGNPSADIMSLVASFPKPEFVFYLKANPNITLSRIRKNLVPYECGMDESCSDNSFLNHQNKIIKLLDIWSKENQWIELDANLPTNQLIDETLKHLKLNTNELKP